MKLIQLVVLILLSCASTAQEPDSIGVNNSAKLNLHESQLLESLLKNSGIEYDLTLKKAAFIASSSASQFETKSHFFQHSILPWTLKGDSPSISMVTLTEDEKQLSGGYDVLVLGWVVILTKGRRKQIVKELATLTH